VRGRALATAVADADWPAARSNSSSSVSAGVPMNAQRLAIARGGQSVLIGYRAIHARR
jgi:hypothetical protein